METEETNDESYVNITQEESSHSDIYILDEKDTPKQLSQLEISSSGEKDILDTATKTPSQLEISFDGKQNISYVEPPSYEQAEMHPEKKPHFNQGENHQSNQEENPQSNQEENPQSNLKFYDDIQSEQVVWNPSGQQAQDDRSSLGSFEEVPNPESTHCGRNKTKVKKINLKPKTDKKAKTQANVPVTRQPRSYLEDEDEFAITSQPLNTEYRQTNSSSIHNCYCCLCNTDGDCLACLRCNSVNDENESSSDCNPLSCLNDIYYCNCCNYCGDCDCNPCNAISNVCDSCGDCDCNPCDACANVCNSCGDCDCNPCDACDGCDGDCGDCDGCDGVSFGGSFDFGGGFGDDD